ncbi:hypothetical protein C4580_05840 [Candidatus Woesearchaeota archaeon]|nr:MAG: hypothetical protein C4580_05840 [Candidatus Woesearchaeota archaeon]
MNWVHPDSGKYMVIPDAEKLEIYIARGRDYPETIHTYWHNWLSDFVKSHEAATKKPGNAGKPW